MELFKLLGTIAVDNSGANTAIEGTTEIAEKSESKISGAFGKIGSAAIKVGTVVATGLAAASTAIVAVSKKALDGYAEYEQLAGGVETLFKDSSSKVKKYAEEAFETAGLSANEYLSTVTSFSASLLQSLARTTVETSDMTVEELDRQYEAVVEATERNLELLEESHEQELEAFEKLTDEKIALIDKQYEENLKLIDEERYNKIKAIDAEIDALNAQTLAERDEIKKRERAQKEASLQEKVKNAKDAESKMKAEQELADFLEDIAQEEREKQRKAQIEDLKAQKEAVKEEADTKKKALQEQYEAEKKALKEAQDDQLKQIKKAQKKELDELKKANKQKLSATKEYVKQQKAILEEVVTASVYSSEVYEEAAEKANQAIIDMSDNANKLGTDMGMIQNAYQGFAKQNFTMLDNLKLGYGGTQEEMKRLLQDAEALSGITYDISSYADIVDAIHVIQTEMGITGTTAKEASTTIQGSLATMKAAWKNLLTSVGDENASLSDQIDNFVGSVMTVADNIIPRLGVIMTGIASTVSQLAPIIGEKLPELLESLLPSLITGAVALLNGLVSALPTLLPILTSQIPFIISELGKALMQTVPQLLLVIKDLFGQIWDYFAIELLKTETSFDDVFSRLSAMFSGLWEKMKGIWETVGIPLWEALVEGIRLFVNNIPEMLDGIALAFSFLWDLCVEVWETVGQPLWDAILESIVYVKENWNTASESMATAFGVFCDYCKTTWETISQPIWDMISFAVVEVANLFSENMPAIMEFFGTAVADIKDTWENHLKPVFEAIGSILNDYVKPIFELVFGAIIIPEVKNAFEFIANFWSSSLKPVFDGMCDFLTGVFTLSWESAFEGIKQIVNGTGDAVILAFNTLIDTVTDVVSAGVEKIKELFDFEIKLPDIALPHFSISPSGWKLGDLLEGSIPTLGVEWYAEGGVMTKPTVFGVNGNRIMAGGEAGAEAIAPIDVLQDYVAQAVAGQNTVLVMILEKILDAILALDENMGGNLREALEGTSLDINHREFARLVKAVT